MPENPTIIAMDLEGVLIPEIWIAMAEKSGINELRLTTRDIADYDELMTNRLRLLNENSLTMRDISEVISTLAPLPGASNYLDWLNERYQVMILSGTFYEFAHQLMAKLGYPTLFCNRLEIDPVTDKITGYWLRQHEDKQTAVRALQGLNFNIVAIGDSYNDLTMLRQADKGILFCPSEKVQNENPDLCVVTDYAGLETQITAFSDPVYPAYETTNDSIKQS